MQKNILKINTQDSTLFFSLLLKKFVVLLMKDGKKAKAEKILNNVLVKISLKGYSPVKVLTLAINNVKPLVEVRNVRLKRKSFQVPFPIHTGRQIKMAIKTIINSSIGKNDFENFLVAINIAICFYVGKKKSSFRLDFFVIRRVGIELPVTLLVCNLIRSVRCKYHQLWLL